MLAHRLGSMTDPQQFRASYAPYYPPQLFITPHDNSQRAGGSSHLEVTPAPSCRAMEGRSVWPQVLGEQGFRFPPHHNTLSLPYP